MALTPVDLARRIPRPTLPAGEITAIESAIDTERLARPDVVRVLRNKARAEIEAEDAKLRELESNAERKRLERKSRTLQKMVTQQETYDQPDDTPATATPHGMPHLCRVPRCCPPLSPPSPPRVWGFAF